MIQWKTQQGTVGSKRCNLNQLPMHPWAKETTVGGCRWTPSMASKAPAISTTVSTGKVASTSRSSRPLISKQPKATARISRYLKVAEHPSIATASL